MDRGLVWCLALNGTYYGSWGSRSGQILIFFSVSRRAGDIWLLRSEGIYLSKIISLPLSIPKQGIWRLDRGLDRYFALNDTYYGSRGSRSGQILRFLQIFGGLEAHNSYQVKPTTEIESHRRLWAKAKKGFSVWTEVWYDT